MQKYIQKIMETNQNTQTQQQEQPVLSEFLPLISLWLRKWYN